MSEESYTQTVNGLQALGELIREMKVDWKGPSDSH